MLGKLKVVDIILNLLLQDPKRYIVVPSSNDTGYKVTYGRLTLLTYDKFMYKILSTFT